MKEDQWLAREMAFFYQIPAKNDILTSNLQACAFQLPFGRAYSLLSIKWTFLVCICVYLIGSAVCGAAPTSIALILGRAIAGIGSAGVLGGAYIIISRNTPLRKRSLFMGLIGATFAIATVLGPLIGMLKHCYSTSKPMR